MKLYVLLLMIVIVATISAICFPILVERPGKVIQQCPYPTTDDCRL